MILITALVTSAVSQPQSVPRLVDRGLDEASYVELARQWKAYIEKNGESADALVNLARAYNYSDEHDAAMKALERAVEIDPDHPQGLAFYGAMVAIFDNPKASLKYLEHCRDIAPDYEYGLTNLATSYMRLGWLDKADEVFKTVYKERTMARPLQDFAYNMLVGLPQGAVLITGGDNDTFPPLVLQAGMNFRKDVTVINLSLLQLIEYGEAVFKRHPKIKPDHKLEHDHKLPPLCKELVQKIVEEQKAPIYIATTVNMEWAGLSTEVVTEGVCLSTSGAKLSADELTRLLMETYRLDSVTDWNFAWSLSPKVSQMMRNYPVAMIKLAEHDDVKKDTRNKLLEKASAMADFHEFTKLSLYIDKLLAKK